MPHPKAKSVHRKDQLHSIPDYRHLTQPCLLKSSSPLPIIISQSRKSGRCIACSKVSPIWVSFCHSLHFCSHFSNIQSGLVRTQSHYSHFSHKSKVNLILIFFSARKCWVANTRWNASDGDQRVSPWWDPPDWPDHCLVRHVRQDCHTSFTPLSCRIAPS